MRTETRTLPVMMHTDGKSATFHVYRLPVNYGKYGWRANLNSRKAEVVGSIDLAGEDKVARAWQIAAEKYATLEAPMVERS